jgi:hypothetical protein
MAWVRRLFLNLFSLLLLVSLLGLAYSTSAKVAFSHPDKVESWLSQSKFYDHFVDNAIDQAAKSASGAGQASGVSFADPIVKQTARSAFPPQLFQKDVSSVIDSNYAWLEGKTAKPSFTLDFTQPRQNFAKQVGDYVQKRLAGLRVCTATELAQLQSTQNINPLTIVCRPPNIDPAAQGALVTQQLASNTTFLDTKTITADSKELSPDNKSQPYYQQFSKIPELYQLGLKLPIITGVAALVFAAGILALALRKRSGIRRIGIVFFLSGLILVAGKFIADKLFERVQDKAFNGASNGQLQQSLTDVLHRAENELVRIDLWFGLAFLAVGVIILLALLGTRRKKPTDTPDSGADSPDNQPPEEEPSTDEALRERSIRPPDQPRGPRPPRLIQ